jgi:hypothetical protein
MGVGGQRHTLAALPSGETRYRLYRTLGGPQTGCGRVRKISPLPGFDPPTVQPVLSRYTEENNSYSDEWACSGDDRILMTTVEVLGLDSSVSQKAQGMLPEDGNVMPKHVGATPHN